MYHKVRKETRGAEVSRHKSLWGISSAQAHACLFEAGTRPLCFGDREYMIINRGWYVPAGPWAVNLPSHVSIRVQTCHGALSSVSGHLPLTCSAVLSELLRP